MSYNNISESEARTSLDGVLRFLQAKKTGWEEKTFGNITKTNSIAGKEFFLEFFFPMYNRMPGYTKFQF